MCTPENTEFFLVPPYCKKILKENEDKHDDILEEPLAKIEVSNPSKILQLLADLTNKSTRRLEIKINRYLKNECECSFVFIINIHSISEEGVVQVIQERKLEENIRGILSESAINNILEIKPDNEKSISLDPKIQQLIKDVVPDGSGEVVIVPIIAQEHKGNETDFPVYLVCIVNTLKDSAYISKLVCETFKYCLTTLLNTRQCEEERRLKAECQNLLLVARKLFSHLGDLSDLLKEIMTEARRLTNAERCSLFLLDPDHMHLVAKVFDGMSPADCSTEVRIAADQGIAGHVAATGEILNIKDAYKHPLFYKGMDEATGFKTRNILCFPIRDEDNIVGVAQLCNKIGGNFDYFDEEVARAFSIYCGISIMHSLVYKKIQDAQARTRLSNELMMYHMQVSQQDVLDVTMCPSEHDVPEYSLFSFTPRKILSKETPCYVLKMMKDLGFIDTFRIKIDTLSRFILYVRKGYREVPYHNWQHAFSVAHFAYLALKNFQLIEKGYLSQLEALAYFVSCLCHDIDHRGTTNSFQQQSNSVLASLYSSEGSVMERHHLSQTICTLNTEGCNFLDSLSSQDYRKCLDLIKDMILATDLASHYKIHAKQLNMAQDWTETKKVAQLIYAEFFAQGDLEKKMGKEPANMMDREKASIPDHQLEFLTQCCICIFKILATIFPSAKVLVNAIKQNILCWESSKRIFDKYSMEGKTSYEVLVSEELETEVQNTLDNIKV
ncbi:cGMP-dependent 3',5'-cyclic phosphodiesterase-like isoform X2 [Sitophilus oryzae]|uniref:Phosphodiesterase n=1 Tax=Sitophilus oryzae TaxID=7048 RepID=A0A6J2Y702_SITOR|nr:cGMP-dependent 3',5'-cyclic phosphodiesterase-like isoform X2 [Sitophilus oryzae]